MEILKSIRIKNYRSILDDKIELGNMVSIIGANESGKSNILRAINHISRDKQLSPFDLQELNLCAAYAQDNYIDIEFEIILNEQLIPKLSRDIPSLLGKTVLIKKRGHPQKDTDWTISIDSIPKTSNLVIINTSKTSFKKQLKYAGIDKELVEQWAQDGYFFTTPESNLTRNPFYSLKDSGIISVLFDEDRTNKIKYLIICEILANIQVYFWQYNENNYLKESIILEEFCQKPKTFESVYGIFKIARNEKAFHFSINSANLRDQLINTNSTLRSNLLKEVSKSFNRIFKKSWKTYFGANKIDLKISYEGNNLSFRLDDGRECPPEYRSDGLKWFLTFLINFQSKQKDLSNYILLMDEPGGFLHPQGQKDTLNFLLKLSEKNQIIYSTHQTFLIDKNNPRNVRILDRKEKDRKNDFWPTKNFNIRNNNEHILKDSLLRESLGFTLSDISPINENNILVEGTFDRNVIQFCNDQQRVFDFNFCSVISCGKASNIRFQSSHLIENGLKVICIYDRDSAGISSYNSNIETPQKYKLFISKKKGDTIEDLLPIDVFQNSFKKLINNPKYKTAFKNSTVNYQQPFIANTFEKQLVQSCNKELRQELKHTLERYMLDEIKKNFNPAKYQSIITLLKSIKTVLEPIY